MTTTTTGDGYTGKNADAMRERDNRVCQCGHKCISHGSFVAGEFAGVGMGVCGMCECGRFGTLEGYTHGIISVDPMRIQCDGCGAIAEHDRASTVALFVMLCGIEFVGPDRLCAECRAARVGGNK